LDWLWNALKDSFSEAERDRLKDCDRLTERDSTKLAEPDLLKDWLRLCDLETL